MAPRRIASLCTGYGGLDEAVQNTFGGDVVWHADPDPGAAAILAHHWPDVPNLGDITALDWNDVLDEYGQVDVMAMGFPCQDVSVAGLRAGLLTGNRSGLWRYCAQAIAVLRPSLVVIENVPGLLTSRADGDMEPCAWCLGDDDGEPPLRALGAVLADLAGLGFDAEWTSLAASDVGACHRRNRVFVLAWPSDAEGAGLEVGREGRVARGVADASDADGESGGERWGAASGEAPGRGTSAVGCGCDRASWGKYAAAVHRWEQMIGRAAPCPVDERGRLAPVFVEWMQGLSEGHVTGVAGLSRAQMLRALGNGVMPQQGTAALGILWARVRAAVAVLAA